MANSTGSAANRSSRRCFTFVKVTTPTAPRTPLSTKFAVAEKHTADFLRCEDYTNHRGTQSLLHGDGDRRSVSAKLIRCVERIGGGLGGSYADAIATHGPNLRRDYVIRCVRRLPS